MSFFSLELTSGQQESNEIFRQNSENERRDAIVLQRKIRNLLPTLTPEIRAIFEVWYRQVFQLDSMHVEAARAERDDPPWAFGYRMNVCKADALRQLWKAMQNYYNARVLEQMPKESDGSGI